MMRLKQIKAKIGVFFCTFLISTSGLASTTIVKAATNNLPNRIYIDSPSSNFKTGENTIDVLGWSLSSSGVEKVQATIDGGVAKIATEGLSRPDVNKAYPGYTGGSNSGYDAKLDISSLSIGSHTITISSIGNDGSIISENVIVNKVQSGGKDMPQRMYIDSPANGAYKVNTNTLSVTGWALNGYGVQKVQVYVDDANETDATIGLSRPDVSKIYPGYLNGSNSGFSANLSLPTLSDGSHKIKIVSVGGDGSINTSTVNIEKISEQNMPGRIYIDTPISSYKTSESSLNINGWALNVTGVNSVQLDIDGKISKAATIGLSRPDVSKVYPGYLNGSNSGFTGNLDISSLSQGTHTLTITSTGKDGVVTKQSETIIKLPAGGKDMPQRMYIDTPGNGAYESTGTLNITGWALNGYGVQKVQVYVDDANETDATIGLSRPDVSKIYSGYLNGNNSGFNASVPISALQDGNHRIKIVSVGNDGNTNTNIVNINKISEQSMPGRIYIDSPTSNYKDGINSLSITGWSLNLTGVDKVQVSIDGKGPEAVSAGLSRPDVSKVYPAYANGGSSGFTSVINISTLAYGEHTAIITSIGKDGVVTTQNFTFYKVPIAGKDMPARMYIDTPNYGADVRSDSNKLNVTGWSIAGYGVQKVQVYVDDSNETDATIGISRSDVAKVYSGYLNAINSGFTADVALNNISIGVHKLKVVSIGNDGSINTNTEDINVVDNMQGKVYIDSPNYTQVENGKLNVAGWSLGYSGVSNVKVSIDNGAPINATIGLSRPDVAKVYPLYTDASNSGFTADVDTSNLSVGVHTITIISTEKNGKTATATTQIYVYSAKSGEVNSMIYVDTPNNYSDIKEQNSTVNISGWSLNIFGVQKVQVYLNGIYNGDASIGLSRSDVDKVHPGYTGGANSGFDYNLNISNLNYGVQDVTIKSFGKDGSVTTADVIFYKIPNYSSTASIITSFLSSQSNLDRAESQALQLHNGDTHNNCVYFSSSVLRDIGINVPISMCNTQHYIPYVNSLGWTKDSNIDNLYPGNVCFTVSDGSGYSTHTFIFMGWVSPFDHTMAYVADNQDNTIHIRSMVDAPGIDAFSFAFHN